MADQGIWFKLHCSALDDPDLDALDVADFGRWAKLGAYVKRHGTGGRLTVLAPARALCAMFQVAGFEDVKVCLLRLPGVQLEEMHNSTVSSETGLSVSFSNWVKYQGDFSTPRVAKFRQMKRSKRRGEEKRREERRGEEKRLPPPPSSSPFVGIASETDLAWGTSTAFAAKFNRETPDETPAVEGLSEGRQRKIRAALKERRHEDFWTAVFREFHRSQWLRGLVTRGDYPKIARDMDWLLQRGKDGVENFVKVHEGKYRDG